MNTEIVERIGTKAIVLHTTASNSNNTPDMIQNYFLRILGWNRGGYHSIVGRDGIWKDYIDWRRKYSNGIFPNPDKSLSNLNVISLSYIGGINNANQNEAVCNILLQQEIAFVSKIKDILEWYPNAKIIGHNQINQKACPSFWVPDWALAWGFDEKNIDFSDPFKLKDWVKNTIPHPKDFYAPKNEKAKALKQCENCGKLLA